jgi:exosortase
MATVSCTYILQTLGLPAIDEGNTIVIDRLTIGIVDACNGLSMLFLFFTLAVGMAFVIRRPLVDRLIIIASALPIALVSNIARITATGLLHGVFGERAARLMVHDLAGWLMMPLALALLWLELKALPHVLIEDTRGGQERRLPRLGPPLAPVGAKA